MQECGLKVMLSEAVKQLYDGAVCINLPNTLGRSLKVEKIT